LATGAATRPHLSFTENGDAFVIHHWDESLLVGVIDGLGHGPQAHMAAGAALRYVETHFDLPLEDIFRGVGRACRSTRGVVMALARFDWGRGRVTFASVGNIETRSLRGSAPSHYGVRRGIIGVSAPKPLVEEYAWDPEDVMVLHSDGLPSHWKWDDFPGLAEKSAGAIAQNLLRDLGKPDDDATVVVVRSAVR
jgi:serine/threonine protein phosphatase PrpC